MSKLLELHEVAASYGASQALFNVELVVDEGQVVALMGRNGMGKSSTMSAICRLITVHGGSVRFAGQDPSFPVAAPCSTSGTGAGAGRTTVFSKSNCV